MELATLGNAIFPDSDEMRKRLHDVSRLMVENNKGFEKSSCATSDLNEKKVNNMRRNRQHLKDTLARVIRKKNGLFLEVGAGDGMSRSKTLELEEIGWQGVLIEPVVEQCGHCIVNRPQCAVLNYECIAPGHAEASLEHHEVLDQQRCPRVRGNPRTLTSILDEIQVDEIDLLVLNGRDDGLTVLRGLDLFRYRPEYILAEESVDCEIHSYLSERCYEQLKELCTNGSARSVLYHRTKREGDSSFACETAPSAQASLLEKAWDIAARSNASFPGKYIAYYSLDVDGRHFPGERPWADRWEYIGKALREAVGGDLKGKRILELGCNLGLLSVWAAREGAVCHGYEYESDILEGCRLLASAFGVADRCSWHQTDFNNKSVTDDITDEFDVCTCLSVMNWVRNKDNLIELLSRQKVVIYEGHEKDHIEIERLKRAGFLGTKRVALSERKRSVFLARRETEEY
jgi:hypothetical protein